MTTALKHFELHMMPSGTLMLCGLPIAPTMQAIIIDRVSIVNPQLASIIGDDAESVLACPANSQAACPSHREVITTGKAAPLSACVAIVNCLDYASHVCPATVQVRTTGALPKIEGLLAPTRPTRP
jgi:hypothetical protein